MRIRRQLYLGRRLKVFDEEGARMRSGGLDSTVSRLAEGRIPFPLKGGYFVKDDERVIFHSDLSEVKKYLQGGKALPSFEKAARENRSALILLNK